MLGFALLVFPAAKDNLLFGDEERRTLKLCDFGLSVAASKSQNLPGLVFFFFFVVGGGNMLEPVGV